jgi:hypothetical protein
MIVNGVESNHVNNDIDAVCSVVLLARKYDACIDPFGFLNALHHDQSFDVMQLLCYFSKHNIEK